MMLLKNIVEYELFRLFLAATTFFCEQWKTGFKFNLEKLVNRKRSQNFKTVGHISKYSLKMKKIFLILSCYSHTNNVEEKL